MRAIHVSPAHAATFEKAVAVPKNGNWRQSAAEVLVGAGIERRLIRQTFDEVTAHLPAPDRCTGPFGHFGACIGRIVP